MKSIIISLFIITAFATALYAKTAYQTVKYVDLNRYLGKWYEVGRFPNKFQKNCYQSTATYSLTPKGTIRVLNECRQDSINGKYKSIVGKAKIVDKISNSKLKVTFFWPFYGDYQIIDLGENYEYAVVSEPSMKYLWILSRTKVLEPRIESEIYKRLTNMGFDTSKIIKQ